MEINYQKQLFEFIEKGTSPYHVVRESEKMLQNAGFLKLDFSNGWNLSNGGKYYLVYHGSSLFAFTLGRKLRYREGARIGAAHTDSPCLRIKPHPEMNEQGYQKLNVETYGGAILNTWLDRPLSIAGRVALKSNDVFHPEIRIVDLRRPVLTVPNLAIHINREVNKGVELNKQIDMLPIGGMDIKKENGQFLMEELAWEMNVETKDILDYELSVYNTDRPQIIGFRNEFISAPRLDNLVSVFTLVHSICSNVRDSGINMIAVFDHEEIGSKTKQGAGSVLLSSVLEKIFATVGRNRLESIESLAESMILSLDVSHALHPNQPERADVTNKPVLNGGVCIKEASSQSYATDCEAVAVVQQICGKEGIAFQKSVNRSDGTGGSTLGAIAGMFVPVNIVDLGVPLLAMHSSRELMGQEDQDSAQKLLDAFFTA